MKCLFSLTGISKIDPNKTSPTSVTPMKHKANQKGSLSANHFCMGVALKRCHVVWLSEYSRMAAISYSPFNAVNAFKYQGLSKL